MSRRSRSRQDMKLQDEIYHLKNRSSFKYGLSFWGNGAPICTLVSTVSRYNCNRRLLSSWDEGNVFFKEIFTSEVLLMFTSILSNTVSVRIIWKASNHIILSPILISIAYNVKKSECTSIHDGVDKQGKLDGSSSSSFPHFSPSYK